MRTLEIQCDCCGKPRPLNVRPKTWWVLEQQSEKLTTGALDFCSLACVAIWVQDPRVVGNPAYALDFVTKAGS